ncbi:MAG TPA: DUF4012 domain-containing protein [Ktedonobacterales bacterium]|jgi:hypothetical protein
MSKYSGGTIEAELEMFSARRRSRIRRRLIYLALAVLMLTAIITPVGFAGASALQVYDHIRQLGTSGVASLLKVKDLFLTEDTTTHASCGVGTAPAASPTSQGTPSDSGLGSILPGTLSTASLNAIDFKALTDPAKLDQAHADFLAARATFVQLATELNSHPTLFYLAGQIPSYAKKISEARMIAKAGMDIGTLGAEVTTTALTIVKALPQNPLSAGDTPLITADELALVQTTLTDTKRLLGDIQTQLAQVDLNDLPVSACQRATFAKAITFFPEAQNMLDEVNTLLPIGSWALGIDHPRNFLVQTMDRAELRPGGGFVGQYGVLTINGGRVGSLALQDIAWLDYCGVGTCAALGNHPPAKWSWWPFSNFGLRDANDSGDFPTNAQEAISLFAREGGGQVDGVIDLTPIPIEHILTITGPIFVPDYNETITAENLEQRLHYYQQDPAGIAKEKQISANDHSITARKRFTSLVGRLLQERLRQLPLSQLLQVAKQVIADMRSKDLEVYLSNPDVEALLTKYGLDAAMDRGTTTDTWMVVQANISVSKATQYVHTTEQDTVQLDASGGATHNLTITLNYNKQGNVYGPDTYRDYLRVYAPAGSRLLAGAGFANGIATNSKQTTGFTLGPPTNTTSDEPGLAMWGGLVIVEPSQVVTITLRWYTPHVAPPATSVEAGQSPYTLLVQRQSGTFNTLEVRVIPSSKAASTQGSQPASFNGTQSTNQVIALPAPASKPCITVC